MKVEIGCNIDLNIHSAVANVKSVYKYAFFEAKTKF